MSSYISNANLEEWLAVEVFKCKLSEISPEVISLFEEMRPVVESTISCWLDSPNGTPLTIPGVDDFLFQEKKAIAFYLIRENRKSSIGSLDVREDLETLKKDIETLMRLTHDSGLRFYMKRSRRLVDQIKDKLSVA